MRIIQQFLAVFAVASLFVLTQACQKAEPSSDVNQDKIHQYLELYYNAAEDKTYAIAQFRFGNAIGTPLELSSATNIQVDGNAMTWNDAFNINRYEWEWTGKVASANFVYTDNDGNTFSNTVTINDVEFPAGLTTISKANAYELTWVGAALDADDEVWVYINENNEANGALFKQTNDNATSVTMTKSGMSKIDPSTITLWMDRNNKPAISEATSAGGIVVGKYRATLTGVQLTN